MKTIQEGNKYTGAMETKCLIIAYSYHHNNTAKIASIFSEVLNAKVKTPEQVILEELQEYDLIGFGAGIDSGKHYKPLIDLANKVPKVNQKNAFIFSTSAVQGEKKVKKDHSCLRKILESKGYTILDEFSCKGFNTNSFLKFFGGMNKGRPNNEDIQNAKKFAKSLQNGTVL
ncbi:flavodoxin family protein [Oceanirhabdus sp. W0125-5]|uniref:flavodoxin family protein n=1 Tax=Oceanirhabdus sp. W0125-5 TaxID=2999116 RepID=UPI0022F34885|nr:flavodoxin family protein [Oceanirhabdus sp. W0125-5]WBW94958.1 flavodoxin family protein [Oceanirhabdus sp. W0125-5]